MAKNNYYIGPHLRIKTSDWDALSKLISDISQDDLELVNTGNLYGWACIVSVAGDYPLPYDFFDSDTVADYITTVEQINDTVSWFKREFAEVITELELRFGKENATVCFGVVGYYYPGVE